MANPITAIGLMSGTSMDGIDVALLRTDGEGHVERLASASYPYDDRTRRTLRQALADAVSLADRNARPGSLGEAESRITALHADAVRAFRKQTDASAGNDSLIGFHGQTVLHRPEAGLTVQLGDGQALADSTGLPVIADMRANDMAHGGQGAPLAPAYHRALAGFAPKRPVVFVNIGGVANVTYVPAVGEPVAFDTGPGNALMDDWCLARRGEGFDAGGALAASGTPDTEKASWLMRHAYFSAPPPKSLDRAAFASEALEGLGDADGLATLALFTARSIAAASAWFPRPAESWIVCGGGRHNRAVMQFLAAETGAAVAPAEAIGLNGDTVEAEAWAYLAVRASRGLPLSWPTTTGVREPVSGGVRFDPA